ncbi:MAG: polysaccharide deacetylase family protein [Rubrivivax sp.]|nr:polysaccharide deacetylase family protein [Rubrivivax sp.]
MRGPTLARLASLACAANDLAAGPRLSVLIFHRVLPERDAMFPEEMDAERFEALVRFLARRFRVLTLGDALAAQDRGELPRRAVSITFDDGYADNAEIALPILQRHGLRASFFVATSFLDGGRMFNDSVIECLRRTKRASIDLGDMGEGRLPVDSPGERRAAIDRLLPKVKYASLEQREVLLALLHKAAGSPRLPDDLMMRSAMVSQLHRAGMEIGGHTMRHPILRLLPDEQARAEIAGGRQALQSLIDAPVDLFAYPNGRPDRDYDLRHVEMVRRQGFRAAVSTSPGVVTGDADRFQLPRFTPWDQDLGRWVGRLTHSRVAGIRPVVAGTMGHGPDA